MRCSNCSRTIRPVAVVDIDGTLGDYHGHFVRFAEAYLGQRLPHEYGGDVELSDYLGLDKVTYRQIKLAYRQGGMKRSMPVYPGAVWFMRELNNRGFEVWIATTRPYLRLDNVDPDTREWLRRYGMPAQGIVYDQDKYQQLTEMVDKERIVVVVEDLLEQCWEADGFDLNVWQPERAHNHASRWRQTFERWPAVMNRIDDDLIAWKERYGYARAHS